MNPNSLSFVDGVFYWINDGHLVFEESDFSGAIHVNTYEPKPSSFHSSLMTCDLRNQPIPIPSTPVRNLQVLFSTKSAHIKWDPPTLISQKGRGAWQNWSYHVQIENLDNGASILYKNDIKNLELDIQDLLEPNSTYSIELRPFSENNNNNNVENELLTTRTFIGRTLPDNHHRTIYWATSNGSIQQSGPVGQDVRQFADVSSVLPQNNKRRVFTTKEMVQIQSMAWMQDYIYAVTSANNMYKIHITTQNVSLMENIEAVSVAGDCLSGKIYWSSAKNQMVS